MEISSHLPNLPRQTGIVGSKRVDDLISRLLAYPPDSRLSTASYHPHFTGGEAVLLPSNHPGVGADAADTNTELRCRKEWMGRNLGWWLSGVLK